MSRFNTSLYAWEIYARQLFKLGRGYPLWEPEPSSNGEINIGDVGYVHQGCFYRIFNTITPEADLSDNFETFELRPRRGTAQAIQTRKAAMDSGFHYGRTIKESGLHGSSSALVLFFPSPL